MIEIERMYSCEGSVWHGHLHSENSKCFQQISVNSRQKEFMWPKCGKIRNNEGFSLIAKILRNVIKIAKFQMIFNICFCCFRVPFFHTFYFTNSTSEHHSACHQIVGDNWWSWIVECRTLSRWISWICEIEHSCVISSGFSILKCEMSSNVWLHSVNVLVAPYGYFIIDILFRIDLNHSFRWKLRWKIKCV